MKVLFSTYPMAFHTPGGGEIQLLAYEKLLPSHNWEVTLFDQWNPRFLDHDLVHFFSCVGGSWNFCDFIRQIGLPLVVSSSLWITEETKQHYPVEEIRRQLTSANRVVANSDMECEALSSVLGLPRAKFATILNGVDDIFFETCSPEIFKAHFAIQDPFVLNVGNIEPRKNQLRLISAMKEFPDIKLILIGNVRDPHYARECLDRGKSQVMHLGSIAHDSELLRSAYSACEAFVLPSTLETPGLAALEAVILGCRVAVTKIGSTTEYFGDLVHYVEPESVESITAGISAALNEPRRIPLGAFPKEKYSWNAVTRSLCDIYTQLLAKPY